MTETAINQRTCNRCWRLLPLSSFRRRKAGTEARHHQCGQCFNNYTRLQHAARRQGAIGKLALEINQKKRDVGGLIHLSKTALARFGGAHNIAVEWRRVYDAAAADGRHYLCVRLLMAIVTLWQACGELEATRPAVRDLDDQELESYCKQSLATAITSHPGWAAEALRAAGWTVTPPR